MFSEEEWAAAWRLLRLSPRESEIVIGMFNDQKEGAIADDIGISPHTVHTYSQRIYRKLDAFSRVGVIVKVIEVLIALRSEPNRDGERPTPPYSTSHVTR